MLKTNDPAGPNVPILVEATVQAALTISPNPVALQAVKVGETASRSIVVRGSKPLKVVAIEGTDADLTIEMPTTAAQNHVLTVKFKPTAAGDFKRSLTIKTDLGTETVVVTGTAAP